MHTDNSQVSFGVIEVCQPDGGAIIFSKSLQNSNHTTLLIQKPFVPPKFYKQSLFQMLKLKTVIFFTFKIAPIRDNLKVKGITTIEIFKNHSFNI